jgi:hypothetical protein
MITVIIAVACGLTNVWFAYALAKELRRKQDEINILNQKLIAWEDELSTEMPPEFKDWWQNDRAERPLLATALIQSLKADNERAWKTVLELKKP